MGHYDFTARNVHATATKLLKARVLATPPPWYNAVGSIPSSEILTRKPMRKSTRLRKASRMFQPIKLEQPEDKLRWEFFNDHPWELARPRVVLENDGLDHTRWDWSHPLCRPTAAAGDVAAQKLVDEWDQKQLQQAARPINGEAVVQRQRWLMVNERLSEAAAYDKARKEFYKTRHRQEIEQRVAREEATFYGGIHGKGALEVGMQLEDAAFEHFRKYAEAKITARRQAQDAASTSTMEDEAEAEETVER